MRSANAGSYQPLMRSVVGLPRVVGWGNANPAFRHVFSETFVPGGTPEQHAWFDELARISTSPEMAERLERSWYQIDVTELLPKVTVPTLVAHGRRDAMIPFAEGRIIVGEGARVILLVFVEPGPGRVLVRPAGVQQPQSLLVIRE